MRPGQSEATTASETKRQVLWSAAGFLFPALSSIFLTPYVIRGLGDARYGLFLVAMTTIGFLSLLELGLASAAVHTLTTARAGKGVASTQATFWTVTAIFAGLGAFGGLGLFAGHEWVVDRVFQVAASERQDALFCIQLAALGLGTNLLVVPCLAWLGACERFDLQSKAGIVTNVLATLGAVWRGAEGDLRGALWFQIGGAVASLLALGATVAWLSATELRPTRPTWAVTQALWRFASYQMLSRIAGGVGQQIGKLVLTATLGPAQLAWFASPFSMMQRVQGLLGAAAGVMFPQTARLTAAGDDEAVRVAFRRGQKVLVPLAAILCLPFAFCAEPFLRAWISPEFAARATLPMQVSALAFAVSGAGVGQVNLLLGRGRSQAVFRLELTHVVVHTALLWPLTLRFGATGAALAFAAGWVALAVGEVGVRGEIGPDGSRGLLRVIAVTAFACLGSGLLVRPLAEAATPLGVLGPLACCGLASLASLAVLASWPGVFGEDEAIAAELRGAPAAIGATLRRRLSRR